MTTKEIHIEVVKLEQECFNSEMIVHKQIGRVLRHLSYTLHRLNEGSSDNLQDLSNHCLVAHLKEAAPHIELVKNSAPKEEKD